MNPFVTDTRASGRFRPEGSQILEAGVEIPVLSLHGGILFPQNSLPLASLKGLCAADLKAAARGGFRVGVLTTQPHNRQKNKNRWSRIGVEAEVISLLKLPNGETGAVLQGRRRFVLRSLKKHRFGWTAKVDMMGEKPAKRTKAFLAIVKTLKSEIHRFLRTQPDIGQDTKTQLQSSDDPSFLCDAIAPHLSLTLEERLGYLEEFTLRSRVLWILGMLRREADLLQLSQHIHDQVKGDLEEEQRRHYLQEQIQVIRRELGEIEGTQSGTESLEEALGRLDLPGLVRQAVKEELERLSLSSPGNPEYLVSYNYLQFIAGLPWGEAPARRHPSLSKAVAILNRDHFGLAAVKDRILEYLAVALHKGDTPGQILLFVGPPGVGKTSLARSVAEALQRSFARISLGGVKDEAEIRGHRRTYIGSMPGKLMQAIKNTGVADPVILLDEVDKVGGAQGGDIASALLEVLDREQNQSFVDHYLAVPFDLSHVVFIATANDVSRIPEPLLDRMDVVEVSSYSDQEKIQIAQRYIIPDVRQELGLATRQFRLTDKVIEQLIRGYTREAGVRQLKREITMLGRKTVRHLLAARKKTSSSARSFQNLAHWLGPARYLEEPNDAQLSPGVAIGLAYTEVGGDILYIETTMVHRDQGVRQVKLTGSLGKVMKESAETVLSWLTAHCTMFGINPQALERNHFHIHMPDGGTPKDGPSAGVAILCALTSLLLQKPLPADLAMTGEVSLRGQILPIGGVKEKILAASRYGKNWILIPAANEAELANVPDDVTKQMKIVPVRTMAEVLTIVFGADLRPLPLPGGEWVMGDISHHSVTSLTPGIAPL